MFTDSLGQDGYRAGFTMQSQTVMPHDLTETEQHIWLDAYNMGLLMRESQEQMMRGAA